MPHSTNRFDFNTISDVILHLKYTAREGGQALKDMVTSQVVEKYPRTGMRLFSAKHDFPGEWHRFLYPPDNQTDQVLKLDAISDRFPFQFRDKTIKSLSVHLFLKLKNDLDLEYSTKNENLNLYLNPHGPE